MLTPTLLFVLHSAKAAGVVVMNEIGVDPGVDHLYALKTINEVHAEGGKVNTPTKTSSQLLRAPPQSNVLRLTILTAYVFLLRFSLSSLTAVVSQLLRLPTTLWATNSLGLLVASSWP